MSYKDLKLQSFDEEKGRQGQLFDPSKAIALYVPNVVDGEHSKYIGFYFSWSHG